MKALLFILIYLFSFQIKAENISSLENVVAYVKGPVKLNHRYDMSFSGYVLVGEFYVQERVKFIFKSCLYLEKKDSFLILKESKTEFRKNCDSTFDVKKFKTIAEFYNFEVSIHDDIIKFDIDKRTIEIKLEKNKYAFLKQSVSKDLNKLKNGEYCFQVDDQCNIQIPNLCSLCPFASYPIINSNCKKKASMKCGNIQCGHKNAPACITGWAASDYQLDFCINDSPLGYCKKGLRVFCENNELICR